MASPAVGPLLVQELRTVCLRERTTLVLAAALAAVTVTVLGGRRLTQGPLPAANAVSVVVQAMIALLPGLALLVTGRRIAIRRARGVELAAFLSGIGVARQTIAAAADATVLAAGAVLAVLMGVWSAGGAPGPAAGRDVVSALVGVVGIVAVCALWATAIALLTDSPASFVLVSILTVLVGVAVAWAGVVYPALLRLTQVWPTQAVGALIARRSDQSYSAQLVAVGWWAVVAVVVIWRARPRASVGGTRQSAGVDDRTWTVAGPVSRRRWLIPLSLTALGAVGWGAVVPASLAPYVPWQLRPQWRQQVREHRTSYDVARQFLAAVQAGDTVAAAAAAGGDPAAAVGPLASWVVGLDPRSAAVDPTISDPTVVVVGNRAGAPALWVCLSESGQQWLVQSLRSRADCPGARP